MRFYFAFCILILLVGAVVIPLIHYGSTEVMLSGIYLMPAVFFLWKYRNLSTKGEFSRPVGVYDWIGLSLIAVVVFCGILSALSQTSVN